LLGMTVIYYVAQNLKVTKAKVVCLIVPLDIIYLQLNIIKKTIIQNACELVPEFNKTYQQLLINIWLNGQSESTLLNYGRCLAKLALYFKACHTTIILYL